jgi:cell division transport system permease protein
MRRLDLPLDDTAASRFLIWIVAGLVFLIVVAFGVAAVAHGAHSLYSMRTKLVTVTLPAEGNGSNVDARVDKALAILTRTRGVTSAKPVAPRDIEELFGFAEGEGDLGLPLPRLIDVTLDPAAKPDLEALEADLRTQVPGSSVGLEALSRDRAERFAVFVRAWGGALGIVALVALVAIVTWITRVSLDLHAPTVELLRHMGAADGYVARQFERHGLYSSIWGGLIGFGAGVVVILILLYSGQRMELAGSIELDLRPLDWLLLGCVPVFVALIVTATSRAAAMWGLGRSAS